MDKLPDRMFPGDTGDADEKGKEGKKGKRSIRRRRSSMKVFAARQRETRDGHVASEIILFHPFIILSFIILSFYHFIILSF
jgi:hypothetical protein